VVLEYFVNAVAVVSHRSRIAKYQFLNLHAFLLLQLLEVLKYALVLLVNALFVFSHQRFDGYDFAVKVLQICVVLRLCIQSGNK